MYNLIEALSPAICLYFFAIVRLAALSPRLPHLLASSAAHLPICASFMRALTQVLLGGFFVVNLFLAIVFDEFMRSTEIDRIQDEIKDRAELAANSSKGKATPCSLDHAGGQPPDPKLSLPLGAVDVGQQGLTKDHCVLNALCSTNLTVHVPSPYTASEAEMPTRVPPRKTRMDDACAYTELNDEPDAELNESCKSGLSSRSGTPGRGGRECLRPLVESKGFTYLSLTFLVLNVVVMCMPYEGQSAEYEKLTEALAFVFTLAFTLETALRAMGLGFTEFWQDTWHQFDTFLVVVSTPDLVITMLVSVGIIKLNDTDAFSVVYFRVLRILRMARVLRMLRMMRYWQGLNRIVTCLLSVGRPLTNATLLLFVMMTVFALMGMQLFGGECGSESGSRFHFDYYGTTPRSCARTLLSGAARRSAGLAGARADRLIADTTWQGRRCSPSSPSLPEGGSIRTRHVPTTGIGRSPSFT